MSEARPLSPQEAIPYTPAEAPKEEEQGYQWSNWLTNPLNELKFVGKVAKESIVDPVVDAYQSAERLDKNLPKGFVVGGHVIPFGGGEAQPIPSWQNTLQGGARATTQPLQYLGPAGQAVRQSLVDTSAEVYGVPKEEDLVGNADARRVQGFGQFATETGVATLLTANLARLGGPARQMLPGWMQAGLGRVPFKRTLKWELLLPGKKPLPACCKTRWLIPASCSSWMRTTRFGRPRPRTSLVMPWVAWFLAERWKVARV